MQFLGNGFVPQLRVQIAESLLAHVVGVNAVGVFRIQLCSKNEVAVVSLRHLEIRRDSRSILNPAICINPHDVVVLKKPGELWPDGHGSRIGNSYPCRCPRVFRNVNDSSAPGFNRLSRCRREPDIDHVCDTRPFTEGFEQVETQPRVVLVACGNNDLACVAHYRSLESIRI